MSTDAADFWTDKTSVLFTSFWGWTPETWGAIGWTGTQGLARRTALLRDLTDPFIAVIYITQTQRQEKLRGKIVGFYLMSHEVGLRNEFTHPSHQHLAPRKWEHSLRALRAFSYVPEYCLRATEFFPGLAERALAVSKWCEKLRDPAKINRLRNMPWVETAVYNPARLGGERPEDLDGVSGFTRAGPANRNGYVVSSSAQELKRQLYVFRLNGSTDAFLGRQANGQQIYKIGLSASPELRRQSLQSALPKGSFQWVVHFKSEQETGLRLFSFEAAVAGEYAMKKSLVRTSQWLGGEFYLASETDMAAAWMLGNEAANNFRKS